MIELFICIVQINIIYFENSQVLLVQFYQSIGHLIQII